jgi:hypothetical protein
MTHKMCGLVLNTWPPLHRQWRNTGALPLHAVLSASVPMWHLPFPLYSYSDPVLHPYRSLGCHGALPLPHLVCYPSNWCHSCVLSRTSATVLSVWPPSLCLKGGRSTTHEPKRARKGREGTKIILLVACSRDKKPYFHGITTTDWFITVATFTAVAIEATMWYFHRRLER